MKKCRVCGEIKEISLFVKNKGFKSGIDTICLDCSRKRVKQWRKDNPQKRALQIKREYNKEYIQNKYLRHYYGITVDDYNIMFKEQKGCCAICNRHQTDFKRRLSVDHDHLTGKIRGLLCSNCNSVIGHAKDNITILTNSITYLKRHTGY